MTLSNFSISFENSRGIFFSGHVVAGRLSFVLTKEKRMRGVLLHFQGKAFVDWSEATDVDTDGKDVCLMDTNSNRQIYVDRTIYVAGGPNDDFVMPPGDYSYAFRFILPRNLPSSFEGEHGSVRYVIKGIINRPWRFDHKCQRVFTVLCPLDLNNERNIQNPFQAHTMKVLCCGWCGSDSLSIDVSLPFRGFVPGQEICALIDVDNTSREEATIKCNLMHRVRFTSSYGRHKVSRNTLARQTVGHVGPRGCASLRTSLVVPAAPASFLRNCNFIEIRYFLQVKGEMTGFHRSVSVEVPVTIGTIPLGMHIRALPRPLPGAGVTPRVHRYAREPPPPYPAELFPQMPPPTYEECTSSKTARPSSADDEVEFSPSYPVYSFA